MDRAEFPPGARENFDRALRFLTELNDLFSPTKRPFRWGTAYFNEDFPLQWDFNFLKLETYEPQLTAEVLAREADEIQGAAGIEHRQVTTADERVGARLASGFHDLRWVVDRHVVMAHRREPDRLAERDAAEEVDWARLRPMRMEFTRAQPYGRDPEVAVKLIDAAQFIGRVTGARYFGAINEGRVVAAGEFYSDGRTAQIEDVATLEPYRGRGLGRAVVLKALEAAIEEGNDLVFLVADSEDWPRHLYEKLGFDPVGYKYTFLLSDTHPKAAANR